jgi:hypothetical protein
MRRPGEYALEIGVRRLAFALLFLFPIAACGQAEPLAIQDAWARDTIGRSANAAVFMTIRSPAADRLVAASAPVANRTDLMTMTGGDGAMAMKYLEAIDIPAGEPVSLDPTRLHVWLADLKQPLEAGQTFPLLLEFEKAGKRQVTVRVIKPAEAPPMSGMRM